MPTEKEQKILTLLKLKKKTLPKKVMHRSFLETVGSEALKVEEDVFSLFEFIGDITSSFGRLVTGKAFFSLGNFLLIIQECGIGALFLVSLISMLVGMILAFVGAIQLQIFGAQIYIADMVGIGMVRVMGALMTGILMSGRTGASFAAELGIMQTNEEIDALTTLGVNPVEYLVLPRVIALVIMMPLLTLYADFMGMAGGYIISTGMLGINGAEYLHHTKIAVTLPTLWIGLIHSVVFGIIIAVAACLHGIKCGRSVAAVGEATTSAVVSSITSIVIATAIITLICHVLGV